MAIEIRHHHQGALGTPDFAEGEVVGGQQSYHSNERW